MERERKHAREPVEGANVISSGAVLWAASVAAVGAFVWAWIAREWGTEWGWIAWGIGLGTGYVYRYCGGRGHTGGIICVGLTLVAILAGKFFGYSGLIEDQRSEARVAFESMGGPETHALAQAWDESMNTRKGIEQFCSDQDLPLSVEEFREELSTLRRAKGITLEKYRESVVDQAFEEADVPTSAIEAVVDFEFLDLAFIALSVCSAFGLATGPPSRFGGAGQNHEVVNNAG